MTWEFIVVENIEKKKKLNKKDDIKEEKEQNTKVVQECNYSHSAILESLENTLFYVIIIKTQIVL